MHHVPGDLVYWYLHTHSLDKSKEASLKPAMGTHAFTFHFSRKVHICCITQVSQTFSNFTSFLEMKFQRVLMENINCFSRDQSQNLGEEYFLLFPFHSMPQTSIIICGVKHFFFFQVDSKYELQTALIYLNKLSGKNILSKYSYDSKKVTTKPQHGIKRT